MTGRVKYQGDAGVRERLIVLVLLLVLRLTPVDHAALKLRKENEYE